MHSSQWLDMHMRKWLRLRRERYQLWLFLLTSDGP
jgi:hypothetical protein